MNLKQIRKRLQRDVKKLGAPDGYLRAGYPSFDTIYGRDSLIVALQMLEIDPSIARNTLRALANLQAQEYDARADAEPGKIIHTDKEGAYRDKPYYGSVDATPLFLIVAAEYLKKTNDEEFLATIAENIGLALIWMSFDGERDFDVFLGYDRGSVRDGLFHQGWKDCRVPDDHLGITSPVAIVEAQGYAYAAYNAALYLAEQWGVDIFITDWIREKARVLREEFHRAFWWEEESYYYLALDGNGEPKRSVTSNPGHLLFTGIVQNGVLERFVKRLFESDLWTPYGMRTVSNKDSAFDPFSYHLGSIWPHDNWMMYYGLKRLGFAKEGEMIKQAMLAAYRALKHMPELFAVVDGKIISLSAGEGAPVNRSPNTGETLYANSLQAWSSCALLDMLQDD